MYNKKFDFDFKPYELSHSIAVVDGVTDEQSYSTYDSEYVPDYTLVPLTLQPKVSRMSESGTVALNASLTNITWTEVIDGKSTAIATDTTGYTMTLSGPLAGRLKISKNVTPGGNVTLKFHAEYLDPRTKQVYVVEDTHLLTCYQAAAPIPILAISAPSQSIFNPCRDTANLAIKASLTVGADGECPTAQRIFVWEVSRDGSNWYTIGEDWLDYCFVVSSDGVTLTVKRDLMGDIIFIRCRAKYSRAGTPSSVELTDASPCASACLKRRIPKFDALIGGSPSDLAEGTLSTMVTAIVQDAIGVIPNIEAQLLPIWYIGTGTSSGGQTGKTQVAHGETAVISTKYLSNEYGAIVSLEIVDRGGLCAWVDSDGYYITDSDGNILLLN